MDFSKAGIILFTENYVQYVDFYGLVLELPLLHKIDRVSRLGNDSGIFRPGWKPLRAALG